MYPTQMFAQYQQNQVQATPERLVVLLYDGLMRFLAQGRAAMRARDYEKQSESITKAQRILLELDCCLDLEAGGEIAANLRQIYRYCLDRLAYANHRDDARVVEEVLQRVTELREAWGEAERLVKQQRAESQPEPPSPDAEQRPPATAPTLCASA